MPMPITNVIIVDEFDQPQGLMEKHEAHRLGVLHRAISVVILRYDPKQGWLTLLQQRQVNKYHAGGCWSNGCCSHPLPKESIADAAHRRLQEELGFDVPLVYVDQLLYRMPVSTTMVEHELDHLFVGFYDGVVNHFNPEEVSAVKWVKLDDLATWLHESANDFSPWFSLVMNRVALHLAKFKLMV